MSIFNNTNKNPGNETIPEYTHIFPTSESLDIILTETAKEVSDLSNSLYVADVIMEEKVMEGASESVLLENFVKNIWEKIVEIFENLKNKLATWFNNVKKFFQTMFLTGEKFIKTFEDELKKKTVTGYEYKSYKYKMSDIESAADVNTTISAIDKMVSEFGYEKVSDAYANMKKMADSKEPYEKIDIEEAKKKMFEATGSKSDNLSDLYKEVVEGLKGSSEKIDCKDFDNVSKDTMMKYVKGTNIVSKLDEMNKGIKTRIDKMITTIKSASKKFETPPAGLSETVSAVTKVLTFSINVTSTSVKAYTDVYKEAVRDFEGILKGYLRFKPAKEGFEEIDLGEEDDSDFEIGDDNVLEAALRILK